MPHPQDKIAALLDNLKILETQKEYLHAFYLFSMVTGEIFIAFFFFFSQNRGRKMFHLSSLFYSAVQALLYPPSVFVSI